MSKKVIEADVEVVSSKKTNKAKAAKNTQPAKKKNKQEDNPFAAFGGGAEGMPDLSAMFGGGAGGKGAPDLSAMFGKGGMPDLSKLPGLPLKQRIMFKVMSWLGSPKLRFLKSKWSIPIWGVVGVIVLAVALSIGLVLLVWKLLKGLLNPYIDMFRKKK